MKFYQGTTIGFRSLILVVTSWEPLEVRWHLLILQSCKIRVEMTKQFQGSDNGKFNYPWGICTDSLGFIYVCDKENHRIQVFVFFWNISYPLIVIFCALSFTRAYFQLFSSSGFPKRRHFCGQVWLDGQQARTAWASTLHRRQQHKSCHRFRLEQSSTSGGDNNRQSII